MFGFACSETTQLMPFPIYYAHRLMEKQAELRQKACSRGCAPMPKSQVTVEYEGFKPGARAHGADQHAARPDVDHATIQREVIEKIIKAVIPAQYLDAKTIYHVNPTGRFVLGGPHGDCGLTGRKIIVDTYGGMGRHGGGAFSGKDPTKVDRSAAYAARWVAKNVVAAGLAERCEVQLSYAIGIAKPLSIRVDTFGTGKVSDLELTTAVERTFDLRPPAINQQFQLRRRSTSARPTTGTSAAKASRGRRRTWFRRCRTRSPTKPRPEVELAARNRAARSVERKRPRSGLIPDPGAAPARRRARFG
jgi:S-adenosylmethionine synthetase